MQNLIIEYITDSFYNIYNGYLNLCACCSYPFPNTLDAMAIPIYMIPTEGLPGKRYFPEIDFIDKIELEAEKLLLSMFDITTDMFGASIQPHSGTQANQIVYNAILSEEDTVFSLSPKDGGHISHTKLVGNRNRVIHYHLTENGEIDYTELERLCHEYHPKLIILGTTSSSHAINYRKVSNIAHANDALVMADICHWILFIAGNTVNNCFPYVDFATFTLDKLMRGPQGGVIIFNKKFENEIKYSIFPKSQGGPLQNMMYAKYICLTNLKEISLNDYAKKVNNTAKLLATTLSQNDIDIVSGQIDNHLFLINTMKKGLSGDKAEKLLFESKILVNKNQIPNDKLSAYAPSGIRLGATCISNLSFSNPDVIMLGNTIAKILHTKKADTSIVNHLVEKYLIPPMRR